MDFLGIKFEEQAEFNDTWNSVRGKQSMVFPLCTPHLPTQVVCCACAFHVLIRTETGSGSSAKQHEQPQLLCYANDKQPSRRTTPELSILLYHFRQT
jgi:hypothetical protein